MFAPRRGEAHESCPCPLCNMFCIPVFLLAFFGGGGGCQKSYVLIEMDPRKIRNNAKRVPIASNMSIQKLRNFDVKRSRKVSKNVPKQSPKSRKRYQNECQNETRIIKRNPCGQGPKQLAKNIEKGSTEHGELGAVWF